MSGLTVTQLARRAGLGRTTTSNALSDSQPAPSAHTVAALALALRIQDRELPGLLEQTRERTAGPPVTARTGPGEPISGIDPLLLEIHPAIESSTPGTPLLPTYIRRPHDDELAELVEAGAEAGAVFPVLVGGSSTGKTRACWEAVQPLAARGWHLWRPLYPTPVEAAVTDLGRVGPRSVVWLNDLHRYVAAPHALGERLALALQALLTDPSRHPVLVLGTLWPEHVVTFTSNEGGQHWAARELLTRARLIRVPEAFDEAALAELRSRAGEDRRLGTALANAPDGRITQVLAGAPELIRRYEHADPKARALLDVAMDALRLGIGPLLPLRFLEHAAGGDGGYLDDHTMQAAGAHWLPAALDALAVPVHGDLAPLRRSVGRVGHPPPPDGPHYRLADFLEEYGSHHRRGVCPPKAFWTAAEVALSKPQEVRLLSDAAERRLRRRHAHRLRLRAAELEVLGGPMDLGELREVALANKIPPELVERATEHGEVKVLAGIGAMLEFHDRSLDSVELFYRAAAERGYLRAAVFLEKVREKRMNTRESTGRLDTDELYRLAMGMEWAGDERGGEAVYQFAADRGDGLAMWTLANRYDNRGDHAGLARICRQAADHGCTTRRGPSLGTEFHATLLWPHGLEPDGTPSPPWSHDDDSPPAAH